MIAILYLADLLLRILVPISYSVYVRYPTTDFLDTLRGLLIRPELLWLILVLVIASLLSKIREMLRNQRDGTGTKNVPLFERNLELEAVYKQLFAGTKLKDDRKGFSRSSWRSETVLFVLKSIQSELARLEPEHKEDLTNVSFFLYQPDGTLKLFCRTKGNGSVGECFERKNVIANYAARLDRHLVVNDFDSLAVKFENLSNGTSRYKSIFAAPCAHPSRRNSFVGVVTVDSSAAYRFYSRGGEMMDQISPYVALLSMLFAWRQQNSTIDKVTDE